MTVSPVPCAQAVLDVVPSVMRFIRAEMRGSRADLSVPQFRSLLYIARHEGASLREVAAHLGLTPPSASKMIDGLQRRTLVRRRSSTEDRRRITLGLTPSGAAQLRQSMAAARRKLAGRLGDLAPEELETVTAAMRILHLSFPAPGQREN
ncbi:MAG TPA: MarR family transcriptional regulator [Spirochaetia bacterium]|nr:MarR family transcriptional regulator [Spirochaetia bacterium]